MPGGVPQPSPLCARGDHDQCPHWVAMSLGGVWRRRPRQEVILCNDPCHSRKQCPLAGRRKTPRDKWSGRCIYPGADSSRQSFAGSEERHREMATVFADVDLSDHPGAETIERRLRDAFQAHGEQLPPFLPWMSRLMPLGPARKALGPPG